MPNPVVHFEIQSADAEKTRTFFQDVFGWQLNVIPAMGYALVDTQTESGIGGGIGHSQDGQTFTSFYIEVDDAQAYLDKAVEAGGQVIVPVTAIPDAVTMAMFADPAGACVGLVEADVPAAE